MTSLDAFGAKIVVEKPLIDYLDPTLKLSYEPAPPSITIRSIMSTIASSRAPQLTVSIHEDITLEDVARKMRMVEQTRMLHRLVFSVIIAIPSFVLAIVYGSLVAKDNKSKRYLLEPMWAGNASRLEWALLILATPVMFYPANVFHQRSAKEIRALWRRGSRTSILRRFTRFGSMNLLVRVAFVRDYPECITNMS
jgi:cation transport ATPase